MSRVEHDELVLRRRIEGLPVQSVADPQCRREIEADGAAGRTVFQAYGPLGHVGHVVLIHRLESGDGCPAVAVICGSLAVDQRAARFRSEKEIVVLSRHRHVQGGRVGACRRERMRARSCREVELHRIEIVVVQSQGDGSGVKHGNDVCRSVDKAADGCGTASRLVVDKRVVAGQAMSRIEHDEQHLVLGHDFNLIVADGQQMRRVGFSEREITGDVVVPRLVAETNGVGRHDIDDEIRGVPEADDGVVGAGVIDHFEPVGNGRSVQIKRRARGLLGEVDGLHDIRELQGQKAGVRVDHIVVCRIAPHRVA